LKFGLTPSPITGRTCIIVTEANLAGQRVVTGILADSVTKVLELSPEETLPAPAFGTRVCVDYLRGIGQSEGKLVLLLDINKILTDAELQASMAMTEL
ncbi:MAG: chemotaxis protein CheW, partial [Deltaproteobacteria bacterium]|nr:chemotaxis protein CheW [Deltaproteobacteria bacterium]